MNDIYGFRVQRLGSGGGTDLTTYRGKVLLIVNTASKCRFTPQYQGLEAVYERFNLDSSVGQV